MISINSFPVFNGNVIARPFKKFFEEHQLYDEFKPSVKNAKIYEKMDGALGIMFFYKGKPFFCNRQSFKSQQAIVASNIFYQKYAKHLNAISQNNRTYLFEIIYPENRFVVNYGIEKDLYLLDIIDNESGKSINEKSFFKRPNFKLNNSNNDRKNEGFVIQTKNGFKLKIKNDIYKKRYLEIEEIKTVIAKNAYYIRNTHNKENWNVDYNKLYKIFLRKYFFLYLRLYNVDSNNEDNIIKKISIRKVFPG